MVKKLSKVPTDWVGEDDFVPGWWVRDERVPDVLYLGPFDTKAEAEDCKRGQDRFWKQRKVPKTVRCPEPEDQAG